MEPKDGKERVERGRGSLVFRGDIEDNAVLCTKDRTYEVKEAETSNSLLLIPDLLFLQEVSSWHQTNRALYHNKVVGVFYKYFELRPCKPRLQKLRRILEESHYRGPEHEEDLKQSEIKIYSFEDLLESVQASEEELRAGLYESLACEIGGAWRILEHEYHFRVLSYILNLVEENSWPLNKVSRKETLKLLSNLVTQDILEQCFDWYTEPTGNLDFNGMYSLV
uniref:Sister chromatid cohesion protein DCC1 n=1 Tax=Timema bartmani TaxID=61472 RepID=A0A7R9F4L2_9NEOP|nr:unnamed protein product [Timema bartmani]